LASFRVAMPTLGETLLIVIFLVLGGIFHDVAVVLLLLLLAGEVAPEFVLGHVVDVSSACASAARCDFGTACCSAGATGGRIEMGGEVRVVGGWTGSI